ncbi:MAG: guanylate kinase [Prolixibacteraceae bacterium]|nr:guanylate kinase [Prolixibacteraceae bacterium]
MAQSSKLKAQKKGKLIIFSAPSGAGKTTIVKHLLGQNLNLGFSVSATSRAPRHNEIHGKDYFFLSNEEFQQKVKNNEFLEWEEVYAGTCYGTLKSEVENKQNAGINVIFDVDVIGGLNIKKYYGDEALAVFVMPPSVEELSNRLRNRSTETEEKIQTRIAKAEFELGFAKDFDVILVNNKLDETCKEAENIIRQFLKTD